MSFIVDKGDVLSQLRLATKDVGGRPLLLHLDVSRIGVIDALKSRDERLKDFEDVLLDLASTRTVLVPTFNYSFCSTGIYDVAQDQAQVGILNEFVRKRGFPRTRTPVFHFCLLNNQGFSLGPAKNPFGKSSTFHELLEKDGWIGFLGADFATNTFLHFVEESLPVGYRYIKIFRGKVRADGKEEAVDLHYRVRPLVPDAAEYDWPRLKADLVNRGILSIHPVGKGELVLFSSQKLFAYWISRMKEDEMFLLSSSSRQVSGSLYQKFGKPLSFERLEAAANKVEA